MGTYETDIIKPYTLTILESVYASHLWTCQNVLFLFKGLLLHPFVLLFPETSYVGKHGRSNQDLKAKFDAEFSSYIKKSTTYQSMLLHSNFVKSHFCIMMHWRISTLNALIYDKQHFFFFNETSLPEITSCCFASSR